MSFETAVALALAGLVGVYLVIALLFPERI